MYIRVAIVSKEIKKKKLTKKKNPRWNHLIVIGYLLHSIWLVINDNNLNKQTVQVNR